MVKNRVLLRMLLISVLFGVALTVSACYRNAGDDVEPTSNTRVDLNDLQPTTPAPSTLPPMVPPTEIPTETPTSQEIMISPTFTLRPTITPADVVPVQPTASPTESAPVVSSATPTDSAALIPPSFTPVITVTDSSAITTPGMSDVQPSNTPAPTIDPAFQPTATELPPEANPCIHVVQPNDTLFSLAQDNQVTVTDLVAANPDVLIYGESTVLQLGWELHIPGCDSGVTEPSEAVTTPGGDTFALTPQTTAVAGEPIQHVVQPGETIYSIGRLYNVDPNAIIALNNLANPNLIQQGQILLIPSQ